MGPGEPPRQTVLRGRNETDTLQGYGLTLPIPDALLGVNREKAQAITLAEYKLIESQFVTSYEYERAKLITSQLPAAAGYGDWANEQKNPLTDLDNAIPVSYTHLDVYKRQALRGSAVQPGGRTTDAPDLSSSQARSSASITAALALSLIHI